MLSTSMLSNLLRLGSNVLIASWLSPAAFALTGLVMAIYFAMEMLSDAGFKAFVLRHEQGSKGDFLATVWTAKLLRGLLLSALLFLSAGVIATFFSIADLELALQLVCLSFLFTALQPISYISAEREGKVSKVLVIEFYVYVAATLVTVLGVHFTKSVWFLVASPILSEFLKVIVGFVYLGRFGSYLKMNREIMMELLGWAKFILPSSAITLVISQLDKAILGKTLSLTELGLYFIACNLAGAAGAFVINFARRVLEPYLAQQYRENYTEFKTEYYQKRLKTTLLLGACIGLGMGGGTLFFELFYDDRYEGAAIFLAAMLLVPALGLVTYPAEVCLVLHGKLQATLLANLLRISWLGFSMYPGYMLFGSIGIVLSVATIEILPLFYSLLILRKLNVLCLKRELVFLCCVATTGLFTLFIVKLIKIL